LNTLVRTLGVIALLLAVGLGVAIYRLRSHDKLLAIVAQQMNRGDYAPLKEDVQQRAVDRGLDQELHKFLRKRGL
jgi:hypothetical protein